jgi:predicted transcriptional regulator
MCYVAHMTTKVLADAMKRAETSPQAAQEDLAEIAFEIDTASRGGAYNAAAMELDGIDRGLQAANDVRLVTQDEVAAMFAKHRPA